MATAETLYDEAIELQQQGKMDEAVAQEPGYALAHAGLSAFYSKMGKHEEAVAHAEKVCELDPDDPFSFMAKSLVCQRAGMVMEAEQASADAQNRQWAAQRGR